MRAADVTDLLVRDPRLDREMMMDAVLVFVGWIREIKPEQEWLPWSPDEYREVCNRLARQQAVLAAIADAVTEAKSTNPSHFYVVEEGGR